MVISMGVFHPHTPGILVVPAIEKIITVTARLKVNYFNLHILASNKMLLNSQPGRLERFEKIKMYMIN